MSVVLCTYRERIARFGLKVIEHLCKANGVTIVETGGEDGEKKERTLQEDMVESCLAVLHCFRAKMNGVRGGARTKTIFPAGFTERVAALAGSGMSRRDIVAAIESEKWECGNTGKRLGERSVRRAMESLGGAAIIPASVKTFVARRCVVAASKRETTANLYAAYVCHCESGNCRPLGRDKWTECLKHTVKGIRLENDKVTTAYGICLRSQNKVVA